MEIDPQSVEHALRTTRSVRRRLDFDRPIDPEVLEACIDTATQAPTGVDQESWRFLIVTDAEKKLALAELYRRALARYRTALEQAGPADPGSERPAPRPAQEALAKRLHEVPALVLVCAEGRPHPDDVALQVAFYGSILPAAWSLMVALRARGLGSTWTTLHLLHEREAAGVLGIPENVTQTVLLPVAYTLDAVLKPANRKPAQEVTYWNSWGTRRPSTDETI
ncbi:MAG: nitroreductase family protein [bacterium]|nr:nitroreductase family protein [bacterium]